MAWGANQGRPVPRAVLRSHARATVFCLNAVAGTDAGAGICMCEYSSCSAAHQSIIPSTSCTMDDNWVKQLGRGCGAFAVGPCHAGFQERAYSDDWSLCCGCEDDI